MAISKNNKRVMVTLTKEISKYIDKLAQEEQRTVSNLCSKIITDYVSNRKKKEGDKR